MSSVVIELTKPRFVGQLTTLTVQFPSRLLLAFPLFLLLCAGGLPAQQASEASGSLQETNVSEIGLATGRVFAANIIQRDKKQLVYRLPGAAEEKRLPLSEVIFIRSAEGKYEFIFPEEKPEEKPEEIAKASEAHPSAQATVQQKAENMLLAGVGLLYSDNSTLTSFAREYAGVLAQDYNARLSPAGFVAQAGREAASVSALFSVEYRWLCTNSMIGVGAGYAEIPKSSAVVSSTNYSGQETITLDGYAIPITAVYYYRLIVQDYWAFEVGLGGGALFTSVLLGRNYNGNSSYEEARGLAPMLLLRPELSLRIGALAFFLAIPLSWAEGEPFSGEFSATGLTAATAAATPSLTGIGVQLALGYAL